MGQLTLGEQAAPSTPTAGNTIYTTVATPSILRVINDSGTDSPIATVLTGSWTPTLIGSGTAGTNTYSAQNGLYVKIGVLVYCSFGVTINVKDGAMAGNVLLAGLPFTSAATLRGGGVITSWLTLATAIMPPTIWVNISTTNCSIFRITAAAASMGAMPVGDLQNSSAFSGTLTYQAAS